MQGRFDVLGITPEQYMKVNASDADMLTDTVSAQHALHAI